MSPFGGRASLASFALAFTAPLAWQNRWFFAHALGSGAFDASSVRVLLTHGLLPLGIGAAVLAAAYGFGSHAVTALRFAAGGAVGTLLGAAVGVGLLATAVFWLGLLGLLYAPALNACLALGLLLAARSAARANWSAWAREESAPRADGDDARGTAREEKGRAAAPWQAALAGLAAYALWHTLIVALPPPTEWDILYYHLPLPKLYLGLGAIRETPWLMHSHWPHLMEVLYAIPLSLGRDSAAALIHLACCWAGIAALYLAARGELGRDTALLGCVAAAAQPTFLRLAGTAHSDGALVLFVFLAHWLLWRWRRDRSDGALRLAGVCAGLAAACKLNGMVPLAAAAVWLLWRERGERRPWRPALVFGACAAVVVLPWYLKTAVGAGNPIWPFFSSVLGGRWGAEILEGPYVRSNQWPWPIEADRFLRWGPQYLLLPAVLAGALCRLRGSGRLPEFCRWCLWLAAMFLPFVALHQEAWRFLWPYHGAVALAAAYCIRALWGQGAWRRGAGGVLAVWMVSPVLFVGQNNELFTVTGALSREAPGRDPRKFYLERSLDYYSAFQEAATFTPPGSRTLLLREGRGYYFEGDYFWGDPLSQGMIDYSSFRTPEELWRRWRELGATHVLINEVLASRSRASRFYDGAALALARRVLTTRSRLILRRHPIALYELFP